MLQKLNSKLKMHAKVFQENYFKNILKSTTMYKQNKVSFSQI